MSLFVSYFTVSERAQHTANIKKPCKLIKKLNQFDNTQAANADKETRCKYNYLFGCVVSICGAFLYLFAL